MRRLKALAACCAAAIFAMFALAGCSPQQSYTPPEKTPTVSAEALGEGGVLRVGVNSDAPPLAGYPEDGTQDLIGIDVDMAAALADSMGLKVEVVDVGKDAESALTSKKVDVVLGIDQSSSDSFWKSEPYLETGIALFAASSDAKVPTASSSPKIAAQMSSASSWQVEKEFGDEALVPESDLGAVFEDLASGKAQYVAADAVRAAYLIYTSEGYEASLVALMQQPGGYCVGVLDANTELKQAVSEAVASLVDGGVVSVFKMKWLGGSLDLGDVPLTAGATSSVKDEVSGKSKADDEGEEPGEPASDDPAKEDGGEEAGNVAARAGSNAVQLN